MSLPRTSSSYDDPKYHHGLFDGPNSNRKIWVILILGVTCFCLGMYIGLNVLDSLQNLGASVARKDSGTRDSEVVLEVDILRQQKEELGQQINLMRDELVKFQFENEDRGKFKQQLERELVKLEEENRKLQQERNEQDAQWTEKVALRQSVEREWNHEILERDHKWQQILTERKVQEDKWLQKHQDRTSVLEQQQQGIKEQQQQRLQMQEELATLQGQLQEAKQELQVRHSLASKSTWREDIGRSTWHFLHTIAAKFPRDPNTEEMNAIKSMIDSLKYLYPCENCRNHLTRSLQDPLLKPVQTQSKASLSLWMCKLHNVVNKQLGKNLAECDIQKLDKMYLAGCDECITSDVPQVTPSSPIPKEEKPTNPPKSVVTPNQNSNQELPGSTLNLGRGACPITVSWFLQGDPLDIDTSSDSLTLLVFWSPTCSTCQTEIPELQKLYEKYSPTGELKILGISDVTEANKQRTLDFLEQKKITFPIASANLEEKGLAYNQVFGDYKGIPGALIFRKCKEQWRGFGYALQQIPSTVQKLLRK